MTSGPNIREEICDEICEQSPTTITETAPSELQIALDHHQARKSQEAEAIYRKIVEAQPGNAAAWNLLGLLRAQRGKFDEAIECLRRACAAAPEDGDYLAHLGQLLRMHGQAHQAVGVLRKLAAMKADVADVHKKLADVLYQSGDIEAAILEYRRSLALGPDDAHALNGLGNALADRGQLAEAIAAYERALAADPRLAEAHNNLGNALKRQGLLERAIASYRQAIEIRPDLHQAHNNLGVALSAKGQIDEAIAAYRQALRLKQNYAEAWTNLGSALRLKGDHGGAIAAYERALAINPNLPEAHNNLSVLLRGVGEVDRAISACRRAIAIKIELAEAHNNLGFAYASSAMLAEARQCFEQTLRLKPFDAAAHSNLVFLSHFDPRFDAAAILAEARRWNEHHGAPPRSTWRRHVNDRSTDRRLRIGYVSPDFRTHCQALFTLPLLSHHDRRQFEIYCYSDAHSPDAMTERLRRHADSWIDSSALSHEELAARVREDGIDILIDLTMHMARNRLSVFARKPAPVQASYLAYPGTSGLDAIDYRFSDPRLDPPGKYDDCYSEKTIRLPHTFWCYDPDSAVATAPEPPSWQRGYVTFGCFNNFCKVNEAVIRLWARAMLAVPRSRLMLLCPAGSSRTRVLQWLGDEGIAGHRVDFVVPAPREEYLRRYHGIDICLDTFPYNGHTTSLDAFWMGVPVVTLIGQTVAGRAGLSQLTNLGLADLAADSSERFIRIAAELAAGQARLAELRRGLRGRMAQSPLMDADTFVRDLEAAYRAMWERWVKMQ